MLNKLIVPTTLLSPNIPVDKCTENPIHNFLITP